MKNRIYLSIVIPVRNEDCNIRKTLEALITQDYPREKFELIVVDGNSTDRTCEVVEQTIRDNPESNVRLRHNPGTLSSRGRNIGICESRGQLIGVIDGHVHVPSKQLFVAMDRIAREHNADCLARPAPLLMPGVKDGIPFWIASARRSWLAHSRHSYIYSDYEGFVDPQSSGFAYHRNIFDKVGYFDEAFDAAEDVEFHYRLSKYGILAYTSPALTINSYPRSTLSGLFRQMRRYGIGRARLVRKHPAAFTKETLVPVGVILLSSLMPLIIALAWWMPMLALSCIVLFFLYWSILLAAGFKIAWEKRRVFPALLVAVAIWIVHLGLGGGFLQAIFLPKRRLFHVSSVVDNKNGTLAPE